MQIQDAPVENEQAAGRLGAIPRADGLTDFRVWAPEAASVAVETAFGTHPLIAAPDGDSTSRAKSNLCSFKFSPRT